MKKCNLDKDTERDEVGEAYSTHVIDDLCVQNFSLETWM
jgi:hypothetical protein